MSLKTFAVASILLTLPACRHDTSPTPVVDQHRFVQLYCDLLRNAQHMKDWDQDSVAARRYADSTMAKAGFTDEQFESTLRWYNADVERWRAFSEEVTHTLEGPPAPISPPQ